MLRFGIIFLLLVVAYPPDAVALASGSRARRFAADEECVERPFVCYTYEWLAAKGLPHDRPAAFEKKCTPCPLAPCTEPETFAPKGVIWPKVTCDPTAFFCDQFPTERNTVQPKCTMPVVFEDKMDGGGKQKHVLLPFNVCTREMLAKGTCPVELLSRSAYNPKAVESSAAYFVQCDAGFMVPSVVRQAHETSADPKPALTCVPSLQLAAGLIPADASPFPKEWHDISNPTKITYCSIGSSSAANSPDCVPPPICGESNVPAELKTISDAVPATCVNACIYKEKGSSADYAECQVLDIVDRQHETDIKIYVLDRQMSGPYASLMSAAESLKYAGKEETTADDTSKPPSTEPNSRARRDEEPAANQDYKYPRCVEAKDLQEPQLSYVKADHFLNCDTNPIVLRYPDDINLRVNPRSCTVVDAEIELCTTEPTSPPPTVPEGSNGPDYLIPALAVGGAALVVVIAFLIWLFCCKGRGGGKKPVSAEDPAPTPSPDGVSTDEQTPASTKAASEKDGSVAEAASPASTAETPKDGPGAGDAKQARGNATVTDRAKPSPSSIARGAYEDWIALGPKRILAKFAEFKTGTMTEIARSHDACTQNPKKNRYKDTKCLDKGRVRLRGRPDKNDYIHANYVTTAKGSDNMILTQGPLPAKKNKDETEKPETGTCEDFWRMCVEQGVQVILQLCDFYESGMPKCAKYFPDHKNEPMQIGVYTVTLMSQAARKFTCETTAEVVESYFQIEEGGKVVHQLTHEHWLHWPDRGVPVVDLALPKLLRHFAPAAGRPIVIHCSAGIGRSGVAAVIQYVLHAIECGVPFTNLLDIIKEMRKERAKLVQTPEQYLYVHMVLLKLFRAMGLLDESCDDDIAKFEKDYIELMANPTN